jgi:hypothetical protein
LWRLLRAEIDRPAGAGTMVVPVMMQRQSHQQSCS